MILRKVNINWMYTNLGDASKNYKYVMYLCCDDKPYGIYMYWFDAKKCTFGGSDKMIAFMDVPKPYLGKNRLKLNN